MGNSKIEQIDFNLPDEKEILKNNKVQKPRPSTIRGRKRNQGLRRYRVASRKNDVNPRKTNVSEESLKEHDDKVTLFIFGILVVLNRIAVLVRN